jgi:hypothetical protein
MIEKPRHVRRKPKFIFRLCKRDHLIHLCPAIFVVQEAWYFPGVPPGFESYLASQPSLVDKKSCQCNIQLTPLFL